MIDYTVYKLIHYLGILLVFLSLGGVAVYVINGGTKATNAWRRTLAIAHGVGLFLILLGGFGMLARLGIVDGLPVWVWIKLTIWVVLGAALAFVGRKAAWSKIVFWALPLLGMLAAYVALYKPFMG